MSEAAALVAAVRAALDRVGDEGRARDQQRYMKSRLPYRGLTSPQLRTLLRPVLAEHRIGHRGDWESAARELWEGARYREEWYATLGLIRHRYYRGWRDPALLPLCEHLVRTGAWWDVVDEIAAHLVGGVLADYRAEVTPTIRAWSQADHLWVRRTAMLSQLRHKSQTDADLLAEVLLANTDDSPFGRDFFIRKALGWALREYARTEPEWVRAFVAAHEDHLSGLTRREALKHLR